MKKSEHFMVLLILLCIGTTNLFGQNSNKAFKLVGKPSHSIEIDSLFTESTTITIPFTKNVNKIYGLAATMHIALQNDNSVVNLVLIDDSFNEYLIYQSHALLESKMTVTADTLCEETGILDGIKANSIRIELTDANVKLIGLSYTSRWELGGNLAQWRKERKEEQNAYKVKQINKNLKAKGKHWVAGPTSVSQLSYSERKKLYGQSTFPPGFEFYAGGVISTATESESPTLKSATASSPYVEEWDWRNRHGRNWITAVANQGLCGSCWAFASTGAVEAMVNVYYNQQINLDLSEQDALSCSGAGSCDGGYPGSALHYIMNTGIVDEAAFPYAATDLSCSNKSKNPSELIKIGGKVDFGSSAYPKTEDDLKRMLIEMGPISGGLYDWSHAMVLVGYKVVEEGDVFYYRDLNLGRYWKTIEAGDPLIGKLVWIFKNSWGIYSGDQGYVYVETPITNMGWTHAIQTPITSSVQNYQVVCEDRDGDGYYWWGLGEKPANCPDCPDLADGDDSDATLGPLDEYGHCIPLNGTPTPVASFSVPTTTMDMGTTVTFTDMSTNTPTSWSWNFEGGSPNTSSDQNPTVTYDTKGTFKVSLTASNASGSDTKSIENYIVVNEPIVAPVAGFSADITNIVTGQQVEFSDLSTNTPTAWSWTFEGGNPQTSSQQYPTVTYENAGSYVVSLIATNAGGADTISKTSYIVVNEAAIAPIADFTAATTEILVGQQIVFEDLSINKPNSWTWDFEGGTCEDNTAQNPVVTYNTPGTYSVSLTVANAAGEDTKTRIEYIHVSAPISKPLAEFSVDQTTVTEGESVIFSDLSTNAETRTWIFEGGTPYTSSEQYPRVTYESAGSYEVSLIATNAGGADTISKTNYITVNAPAIIPLAEFSVDKTNIVEGESVIFSDLSTNAESLIWTFEGGNPETSTEPEPVVSYANAGSYSVTLTAINGANSDTKTVNGQIVVAVQQTVVSPVAAFSADKRTINVGESVRFSDSSTDASSRTWTFTGGNPETSTEPEQEVTYASAGLYAVSLTVNNGDYSDTKTENAYIEVIEPEIRPVAEFEADNTVINEGQDVLFSDKSANNPKSWKWEFEGGTPSTSDLKNPKVKYNSASNYRVSLTVTNSAGEDQKLIDDYIQVEKVVKTYCTALGSSTADWIAEVKIDDQSKTSSYNGYSDFTSFGFNLKSGYNQNITLTPGFSPRSKFEYWAVWIDYNQDLDFSDSEKVFSSSKSKSAVSGTFNIPSGLNLTTRMRVIMSPTAPESACGTFVGGEVEDYTVSLYEPAPEADFIASSTTVTVGQTVQFNNTSQYNPTSFNWSFNGCNIETSKDENPIVTFIKSGSHEATLIVSNDIGTSQKSMTIVVNEEDNNNETSEYCIPENISSARNYIKRVVFAGIDNETGGEGYQLPELSADNLIGGQPYRAELYPYSSKTRNYWKVWIDFDKNGVFNDDNELVLIKNGIKGLVSADIAIPTDAEGSTRMRIVMKVGKAPASCEDNFDGEVEDYFVSFNSPQEMKASASNPMFEVEPVHAITIYPNPTNNHVFIDLDKNEEGDRYSVYDLSGKVIVKDRIVSSHTRVELSECPQGMYLLRVVNNNQTHIEKIIKKD